MNVGLSASSRAGSPLGSRGVAAGAAVAEVASVNTLTFSPIFLSYILVFLLFKREKDKPHIEYNVGLFCVADLSDGLVKSAVCRR